MAGLDGIASLLPSDIFTGAYDWVVTHYLIVTNIAMLCDA